MKTLLVESRANHVPTPPRQVGLIVFNQSHGLRVWGLGFDSAALFIQGVWAHPTNAGYSVPTDPPPPPFPHPLGLAT